MDIVKGSTTSEQTMIMAIQNALGAVADGMIGTQTMSDIAVKVGADCFPLTPEMFSSPAVPVIIAKDIMPFTAPSSPISGLGNTISGSFIEGNAPCSICVSWGKDIWGAASKAWAGYKETAIYRYYDGSFGIKSCQHTTEIPNRVNVKWAVGGMGLLDYYDPAGEGFCGFTHNGKSYDHSDVLRQTDHTVLGVKKGYIHLAYYKNMTAAAVNAHVRDKLKLELAIMMDGGSKAAMNGAESFAKINGTLPARFGIQAL